MRECMDLVRQLKGKPEVYAYIQSLIRQRKDMFLCIRDNYLNIYYKGENLAKIYMRDKDAVFEVHKRYLGIDVNGYQRLTWKQHSNSLDQIKENIISKATHAYEKMCQQEMIYSSNNKGGQWYYIDMEYPIAGAPLGRFDMIAVKREPDQNGKHLVALVELKIGTSSYSGMDNKLYAAYENIYRDVKENSLYHYQTRNRYAKFGSGLAGHLCNFMRYLNTNYYEELKKQIVYQVDILKELEILEEKDSITKITSVDMLSEQPEVYFVSVSHLKDFTGKKTSVKQMKNSFYNYLYTAQYAVEKLLNHKEIEGLLQIKNKFLDMEEPTFELEIGAKKYRFHCVFVDADKKNYWEYLQ